MHDKENKGKNLDKNEPKNKKSTFKIPTLEITEKREQEILDNFTKAVIENGFEVPAILFLTPMKPISPILSQVTLLPFAPLLEAFNIPGYDYIAFLRKIENMEKVLDIIEEHANKKTEKKDGLFSNFFKKK